MQRTTMHCVLCHLFFSEPSLSISAIWATVAHLLDQTSWANDLKLIQMFNRWNVFYSDAPNGFGHSSVAGNSTSTDLIGVHRESDQTVTSSLPDKVAGNRCSKATVSIVVNKSYQGGKEYELRYLCLLCAGKWRHLVCLLHVLNIYITYLTLQFLTVLE